LIAVPPFAAWVSSLVSGGVSSSTEPTAAGSVPAVTEPAGTAPAVSSELPVPLPDSVAITPGPERPSGEMPEEKPRNEPPDGEDAGSPALPT
jgi:hypothetical protein